MRQTTPWMLETMEAGSRAINAILAINVVAAAVEDIAFWTIFADASSPWLDGLLPRSHWQEASGARRRVA
jgi:hypothetical protein